jgi:arylsulfatase A-like enzyme
MRRLTISIFVIILFFGFFNQSCKQKSRGASKPNVILIMTDDQGYGDLACHGNPYIETPHLDKLHSESIRFTNFHTNTFCAPTRAALMTGRFSDLTHVRTTINGRNQLNVNETTMAEYFKTSGYKTGHFGKWHLGVNYPFRPIDRGFDQWVGVGDGGTGTASDYWGNDKMNDTYIRNGKWEKFEGFATDIFFDETMKFIDKNKDEPFFVYLATNVPHSPWNVPKDWRATYEDKMKEFEEKAKLKGRKYKSIVDFYATISRFDQNLGRLRKYLSDSDLSDNTIIIFLTDNGTAETSLLFNAGMKGHKYSVYEGGHRVPCFIHWPAKNLNVATDIDLMTAHIDILPTLIDLCELETPEKVKYESNGRSWSHLLKGDDADWQDRTLFLHAQNLVQQHEKWKNSLVATEEWRLVNKVELYDIKSDPGQINNVAEEHPEIVADLQQRYEKYWEEIDEGKSPSQKPVIGSGKISKTWLTSDAWIPEKDGSLTFFQGQVTNGTRNFGYWPVTIIKNDSYQFEVRRWPKEVNCPISSAPEAQTVEDVHSKNEPVLRRKGKSIPAIKVKLRVGDEYFEKEINAKDEQAVFNIKLEKGDTEIQAWLIDLEGKKYPAYYVYVNQ